MADKLKAPKGVAAADLKRVVKDINRHRERATENAGLAGQAAKVAIEQYSLDRGALTKVAALSKKEPATAQAFIRAFMDYADKLGLLDQVDAFDDLLPTLKRIVERAENIRPPHGAPADKTLGALMGEGEQATVQ